MPKGYNGRLLRVNLTTGESSVQEFDDNWCRTYLGGWGMIAYILLNEVPADCDPLGSDNKLIVAAGIMTGAPLGGTGRNAIGAKSPLTGGFGESDVGGFFGAELRHAGWDGIIVEGVSDRPVYLWVKDGDVETRDASHLWGKKTGDVESIIKGEIGDSSARVCQIGPAGENLSLLSCVVNDVTHFAGRCGLGAVMGSKKLRAIAVRGTGKLEMAEPDRIREWARWQAGLVAGESARAKILHDHGTMGFVLPLRAPGGLPTRNFQSGFFEGAEQIDGELMTETILKSTDTCFACPIACKRVVETDDEWKVDPTYGGPEYETGAALGSLVGVDDLPALCKANELCNAYGLDTIGVGAAIAWAMECYEDELISVEDTGGVELRFGNARALVQLVEQIALRQGFGDVLAGGAYRASAMFGDEARARLMHVKKQEVPMHDPRVKYGLNIGYAISATGADHNHNFHDSRYESEAQIGVFRPLGVQEPMRFDDLSPAKIRMVKRWINQRGFQDSVGLCSSMDYDVPAQCDIVSAATGWDFSVFELHEVGERVIDMARVFNFRCGFRAEDDAPPPRFSKPTQGGPNDGAFIPEEEMADALSMYYDMMGWDHETGAPLPWKLHELGLSWLVDS